jgi:hypothetical protein
VISWIVCFLFFACNLIKIYLVDVESVRRQLILAAGSDIALLTHTRTKNNLFAVPANECRALMRHTEIAHALFYTFS